MVQSLHYLQESASQTAGPFLHIGMVPAAAGLQMRSQEKLHVMAGATVAGEHIRVEGRIFDGSGTMLRDAQVEVWQANSHGRYNHPDDQQAKPLDAGFSGWGRAVTDFDTGIWYVETIKPGRVPGRAGQNLQAPHLCLWITARGINLGLHTRMYFGDEEEANEEDPVINLIEQPSRRPTLIAKRTERDGQIVYVFDIVLQGENETVFLDI